MLSRPGTAHANNIPDSPLADILSSATERLNALDYFHNNKFNWDTPVTWHQAELLTPVFKKFYNDMKDKDSYLLFTRKPIHLIKHTINEGDNFYYLLDKCFAPLQEYINTNITDFQQNPDNLKLQQELESAKQLSTSLRQSTDPRDEQKLQHLNNYIFKLATTELLIGTYYNIIPKHNQQKDNEKYLYKMINAIDDVMRNFELHLDILAKQCQFELNMSRYTIMLQTILQPLSDYISYKLSEIKESHDILTKHNSVSNHSSSQPKKINFFELIELCKNELIMMRKFRNSYETKLRQTSEDQAKLKGKLLYAINSNIISLKEYFSSLTTYIQKMVQDYIIGNRSALLEVKELLNSLEKNSSIKGCTLTDEGASHISKKIEFCQKELSKLISFRNKCASKFTVTQENEIYITNEFKTLKALIEVINNNILTLQSYSTQLSNYLQALKKQPIETYSKTSKKIKTQPSEANVEQIEAASSLGKRKQENEEIHSGQQLTTSCGMFPATQSNQANENLPPSNKINHTAD